MAKTYRIMVVPYTAVYQLHVVRESVELSGVEIVEVGLEAVY